MRLRNIPGSREEIDRSTFVVHDPGNRRGHWREYFGNDHPVHMEVGMGKGRFLMDMAARYPGINFVGIEMYSSVLLRAVQKAEEREEKEPGAAEDAVSAEETCPRNFCFLRGDARNLPDIFAPGEVEHIYLNFSDPWPKERHAKRRLTSTNFLQIYEKILIPHGRIEFKTDNQELFRFSLLEAERAGWRVVAKTWNLHQDEKMNRGNIMTEYEEKFSSRGNPICKMISERP